MRIPGDKDYDSNKGDFDYPENVWFDGKVKSIDPNRKDKFNDGTTCLVIVAIPKLGREFFWFMANDPPENLRWKWRAMFSACNVKTDSDIQAGGDFEPRDLMGQSLQIKWLAPKPQKDGTPGKYQGTRFRKVKEEDATQDDGSKKNGPIPF